MIVILHQRTHPKRLEDLAQDHPGSNLRSDTLNPVLLFFQRGCLSMLPLHLKRLWLLGCLSSVHWKPILESLESYVTFNPWSHSVQSVQSLSHVQFFATPWTVALQASLSITNSWSLLKLMSIESVMPSNHLILCHPLLLLPSIFPASGSFPMSQFFTSGGQSIGVSASASVLPMNT